MQGQLKFDESMNISEERNITKVTADARIPMVDPCYYCLCNSCIYNAESMTITPEELPEEWEPCFCCDECRCFDGDLTKKYLERTQCQKYIIDNYHAAKLRKKFRLIK